MNRKFCARILFVSFSFFAAAFIWDGVDGYAPSVDGVEEAEIAMADMRRYCAASKIDCTRLHIEERYEPTHSPVCQDVSDKWTCTDREGHWGFVVSLGPEHRYMIAVLPFGSEVVPGPLTEITPLNF